MTLTAERQEAELAIVVKATPAAATIRGRVLDEGGAPASGARVADLSRNGWSQTTTDEHGSFTLHRAADSPGTTAQLRVFSDLYGPAGEEKREVAWGTQGVELRVGQPCVLTLRITDAAQAPVESYVVRLLPRNRDFSPTDSARVRAHGRHPDGTASIKGLTRGDWLLIVDFPASTGLQPLLEPFHHEEGGDRRMDLRAEPAAVRTLRVVAADDAPVAGTRVQLCELHGHPFADELRVVPRTGWLENPGSTEAVLLFEGRTGSDGRLELRGPAGRELGLCLLGPGHVPLRQSGVRLDAEGECTVRVSRGARLVAKVVPPEALEELRRMAGFAASQPFPSEYRPRLELALASGRPAPRMHGDDDDDLQRLVLSDEGTCTADGLPPGSWRLRIRAWTCEANKAGSRPYDVGTVLLTDGETLHRDLDLQAILPGTLEGLVLVNGRPLVDRVVTLHDKTTWTNLRTDADGRFTRRCLPGEYGFLMQLINRTENCHVPWPLRVRIARGEVTRQTFALSSARLQITLRNADGAPVGDAQVEVRTGDRSSKLPATTADGRSDGEFAAATTVLRILPKQFASEAARRQLRRDATPGSGDPLERLWITLATVTLSPGVPQEFELKLPADSGY